MLMNEKNYEKGKNGSKKLQTDESERKIKR